MKNRWPKSIHSQTEAVFHAVRSFRQAKTVSQYNVRSFGTWKTYKYESHRFAEYLKQNGIASILDTVEVQALVIVYLQDLLERYAKQKKSRQSFETILSALGKFEYAINCYLATHLPDLTKLDIEKTRMEFYKKSKTLLSRSSKDFDNRAYPDPVRLIEAISDATYQLQASLQYEGGLRTEGVGAPSNRKLKNPLTINALRGIIIDPVTGLPVGVVASKEKGGKITEHFISMVTYQKLEKYINRNDSLESNYADYVDAINRAALATLQHAEGRGSHGLKHCFAQERYLECVSHGMRHEQALQQVSLETSHYRLRETLTYTRG